MVFVENTTVSAVDVGEMEKAQLEVGRSSFLYSCLVLSFTSAHSSLFFDTSPSRAFFEEEARTHAHGD